MGIVGVLLAGGCPFPPGHSGGSREGAGAGGPRGPGAKVTVGSSVTAATAASTEGKKKKKGKRIVTPLETASTRVLVVAPSNAAVDELVLRLCQGGVPGVDGGVRFPRVVRVGGGRMDRELDGEGGGGGGGGGAGGGRSVNGGKDGLRSKVIEVGCVYLCCVCVFLK